MDHHSGGSRSLDLLGGLLAFVLSAIMGCAFLLVVNTTHDIFSGAALANGLPSVTAVKSQISSKVRYVRLQISTLTFDI